METTTATAAVEATATPATPIPGPSVSYTQLRTGAWGLRLRGFDKVEEGQEVEVKTKGGDTRKERVGKIVWTGTSADGSPVVLAGKYGEGKPKAAGASPKTQGSNVVPFKKAAGARESTGESQARDLTPAEAAEIKSMFDALG